MTKSLAGPGTRIPETRERRGLFEGRKIRRNYELARSEEVHAPGPATTAHGHGCRAEFEPSMLHCTLTFKVDYLLVYIGDPNSSLGYLRFVWDTKMFS